MNKFNLMIMMLLSCLIFSSNVLAQPLELPIYGFGDLSTIPVPQSFVNENYIGDAPLESILDYRHNDKYWTIARSVGMLEILLVQGNSEVRTFCTATLISEDMILTNAHCVPGDKPNTRVLAANLHMGYDQQGLNSTSYPVTTKPLETNKELDYSILKVSNSPSERFGFVTMNMRPPNPNERLFIIQHAEAQPKRISRNCGFFSRSAITPIDINHRCDTRGGSSGSLVFAESDGSVIGLHFASHFQADNPPLPAERYNMAKRLDRIFEFSSYLPEQLHPSQGYLNINSNPSGAAVMINEQVIGNTPLTDFPYDVGAYQLSLSYPNYYNYNENIHIIAQQPFNRTITLQESPRNEPPETPKVEMPVVTTPTPPTPTPPTPTPSPTPTPPTPVIPPTPSSNALITTSEQLISRAAQGGRLELAAGTFRLDAPLELSGNIELIGQGYEETKILSRNADYILRYNGNGSFSARGISFERNAGRGNILRVMAGNIRLEACQFTGGAYFSDDYEGAAIVLKGQSQSEIHHNLINDNGTGIYYTDNATGRATENDISNNIHGISVYGNASPQLEQNNIHDNQTAGISYQDSAAGIAINNEVFANSIYSILVAGSAEPQLEQNNIHDNARGIVYQDSAAGIAISNEISGSNDNNEGNGITVLDNAQPQLEQNKIHNNKYDGISISDNAQPQLDRNHIHDNSRHGILYGNSAAGSALGNEIFTNSTGIFVENDAQPQLEQNSIHDNGGSGIYYKGSAAGNASHNEIYGNGFAGIRLRNAANPTLNNNTFYDNQEGSILDER